MLDRQTRTGLMILAGAIVTSACGAKPSKSPRALAITLASKTDDSPFFARLATNTSRIIVTESQSSSSGIDINIPEGQDLYSVELNDPKSPKLRNELFREERVVLFTAQDDREAFEIASHAYEFAHPRKVDTTTLKQPSASVSGPTRSEPIRFISSDDLTTGITIDTNRMKEDLESLSGARPITVGGQTVTLTNRATADNKNKARAWLRASYEALGYQVTEQRYSTGINLVAEKKPASPADNQIFVVSGHLDTVQTAGADDDGSGVISSLTVARALATTDLKRTIRFVAFDEEERGLIGSAAYADELVKNGDINKVSVFNIEMTGYDSDNDGDFHTIDCNENSSPSMSQALMSAITNEGIALKKVDACTNRSDHAVFWEHNRPAIVISQNFFGGDSNPCYHRACDTVQKLNWEYMAKMTRASANAIANINR